MEDLQQDINDKTIVANQAYDDMIDAIEWYKFQREELIKLMTLKESQK